MINRTESIRSIASVTSQVGHTKSSPLFALFKLFSSIRKTTICNFSHICRQSVFVLLLEVIVKASETIFTLAPYTDAVSLFASECVPSDQPLLNQLYVQ